MSGPSSPTRRRIPVLILLATGFFWSCDDPVEPPGRAPTTAPGAAAMAAADDGGAMPPLVFLRPVVPRQPSVETALNTALLPYLAVEICALAAGECGPLVRAPFTAEDRGSERLRVEEDEPPHFQTNWHTGHHAVEGADHYRITVRLADLALGHADVFVMEKKGEVEGGDASEYVTVRPGSMLPIKFHVSDLAQVVGADGGAATFAGGAVQLSIPAGALPGPTAFTAQPVADPPAGGVSLVGGAVWDMGPDGFLFPQPVELTIGYDEARIPVGIEEHELRMVHFENGAWQRVPGIVNTAANAVSGSVTSFSPFAPGGGSVIELIGDGTATIDGVVNAAEWADAGCVTFPATLPAGGTTPAHLCVMNDAANLYVSIRYDEAAPAGDDNILDLRFDNLDDGRTQGDDALLAQASVVGGSIIHNLGDLFLNATPGCPSTDGLCPEFDDDFGGTIDVVAAFANTGGVSAHEFSHPLDTADDLYDFSVAAGHTLGLELLLSIGSISATTLYPLAADHLHVLIRPLVDQEQPIIDASVGGLAIGGTSDQILAQTVTAGIAGDITEVRFPVACASGALVVEIQGVTATGQPDGVVRASTSIAAASLPAFFPAPPEFRGLSFSSPASIGVGDRFAIVLDNPTGECGVFQGPVGDPYAGGSGFFDARPNPVGVWEPLLGSRDDLAFQTVVR